LVEKKTFLKGEAMELRSKDGRILTTRKLVDPEENAADERAEREKDPFDLCNDVSSDFM